ncbi:glycosyltransferase family 4 protein [Halalkalibaculum sp. DA384]|uniref:glycosyltransferase family 4 protein n=1 Tax=Halalkalibaculum sp. DA384 TaxID=3373606 RepID=UPI003755321E
METKEKIIVYNRAFCLISETFVYQQARDLAQNFEVHLLAREFTNPHGFDYSIFNQHLVKRPKSWIGRVAGKAIRTWLNTDFEMGFQSYLRLRKLLKKGDIGAIHAHFGPNAVEIMGLAMAFDIPLVVTFHGHDASRLLKNESYKKKLPELFEYASGIIIVSRHMIENLELEPWLEKVHVIPCSVDPQKFVIQKNGRSSDAIRIVHSGRIASTKGVPDLVKVFSELADNYPNIELHIAGDGEELQRTKALARERGHNDKITFYGRVSQEQVRDLLNGADIFVLNSRTDANGDMEGTPVSILEAMCLKKPVVSTIHAGIPDVIQHRKNGLLVPEYANDELKACIERLICDSELREQLGEEAQATVKKSYTNKVMRQRINRIFEEI